MLLLFIVLFLVLLAEFINGWTDAPNAIATVVSTRTLTPRKAILMATTFNILGAFIGTEVATTIGIGIVKPEVINLVTLGAALIAIISWSFFAWRFGLPTSETHALLAGLAGSGLAMGGPSALLLDGWIKVVIGLFLSTLLGGFIGWLLTKLIHLLFEGTSPSNKEVFGKLQLISSSFMALSHGSNDGQKFIGIFSLTLLLGGIFPDFHIPYWVIFLCAIVMGIGTSIGGMRIIRTMGVKIVHLETYQGFAAETAASITILMASFLGIPLSTTHTISTAIIGTGVAKRKNLVRWGVVTQIVHAWLLTFPICGLIAFLTALVFQHFGYYGDAVVTVILIIVALFYTPKLFAQA